MVRRRLVSGLVLALSAFAGTAHAETTLRVSTLAPKNSSWGKVFDVFERAVVQKTGGQLKLKVYYNGVQGMEDAMVSKMKTGQLDGAALTSLGMSKINRNVMCMTLPWLINSWEKLDKVRPKVVDELTPEFEKQGFKVLGWGDVGLVYSMSKGLAVRRPTDLRGQRPLVWRNEPVGPIVYSMIGQVTPVPLSVTEVLPALRAGTINTLSAPALAAEQLQWTPHVDHITDSPLVTAVGGSVYRQKSLDDMPPELRTIFLAMQKKVGKNQNERIRRLDLEAYQRMKKRMTVVKVTEADREVWKEMVRKVLKRLAQGTFPRPLMRKVADLAGYQDTQF